jgi:CPW-WPC domain-containing protein
MSKMIPSLVLAFLCCSWCASSQPAFPSGVGEAVSAMNNETKEVDTTNPDEEAILASLKQHASKSLEADLLSAASRHGLSQAAYVTARVRLAKLLYTGGCPRDLSAQCPKGWHEASDSCAPPDDYEGRCGTVAFRDLTTAAQKDGFAWRCHANWPCQAACKKDFSKCPQSWASVGKLCVAPGSYDGMCSPAMDFEAYALEDKLQWGSLCAATWPCAE